MATPKKGVPNPSCRRVVKELREGKINLAGRPSILEESAPIIFEYIKKGNTYQCACGIAGVSTATFALWMRQGREAAEKGDTESRYFKFLQGVIKAEMDAEAEVVKYWHDCIPGNWQAARDFLARRNPDSWGNKERVEMKQEVEVTQKAILEIPDNERREN